jgi:hypothetical protein
MEGIVPPVTNMTFSTREGISVAGLKEIPPLKRGNPNGILSLFVDSLLSISD